MSSVLVHARQKLHDQKAYMSYSESETDQPGSRDSKYGLQSLPNRDPRFVHVQKYLKLLY